MVFTYFWRQGSSAQYEESLMAAIRIVMGVFVPWQIDPSVRTRGIGLADITRRYQQHQEHMVVNRIDEQ